MDSAVLMVASRLRFKNFGMMAAEDYFFKKKFRQLFLSSIMNLIPVDRTRSYSSITAAVEICRIFLQDHSRNIIMFPEGTRSLSGEIQGFKKGPAIISHKLKVPILPAHINGTYQAMPKGRGVVKPRKIYVKIGEPIHPDNADNPENKKNGRYNKTYRKITKKLEDSIAALAIENRREK